MQIYTFRVHGGVLALSVTHPRGSGPYMVYGGNSEFEIWNLGLNLSG